ncbi:MAG: hypothetical protein BWY39_00205 [Spirochaetes bacterium ADurb.Bin269]|nr:MAG: hypothetical protein BWY39_00205 [Spirochaetes bacterium ADurb.Bin269]
MVTPSSRLYFLSTSSTIAFAPTSMPRVGSETNSSSGSRQNALARHIFCWFPPDSSFAACFEPVHFISSMSMYVLASSFIAFSSRNRTRPPRKDLRKRFCDCIAVKAMFHSSVSSRRRPTPRRSSDTKAMPSASAVLGFPRGSVFPLKSTSPPAGYRLMMPFGMPSLPWPANPPMPKISPSRTSNETFLTTSPGMSTHRFFTDSNGSPKTRLS